MLSRRVLTVFLASGLVLAGLAAAQQHSMAQTAPTTATAAAKAPTDGELIASAMKAAPAAITKNAAVIDIGADGKVRTVRPGTNGFTCMADAPSTPGPDSMCADANAMEFLNAMFAHQAPPANKIGFVYMLEGGTDASNTDPYATAPTATNHWIKTGPHVMIVGAKGMLSGYPRAADPDTSVAYVMWPDTPYEHVMIPVK